MRVDLPGVFIRPASIEDVPFVAKCVLASVDLYDFSDDSSIEKGLAEKVCGLEDTLYSYRHARIAEVDGSVAGCIVSYDGAIYAEARKRTFRIFAEAGRAMDDTENETEAGEYYLDSMAILPAYRGGGIGHALMKDAVAEARENGFSRFSLIVECSKPTLQEYYSQLGFKPIKELFAFGDRYLKMIL
ncbi:MAG: GNAT family N-acetyltransferase [Bacteroidia bacterium]|nr:GNAT family N-acetyltransferase [Bacteroidia bacterium]